MPKLLSSTRARLTAAVLAVALCLLGVQAADASGTAKSDRTAAARTVAHTKAGKAGTRIVGETANGRRVTGSFVPLHFAKRHGHIVVRGLVQGVVHEKNGSRTTFAKMKTMRVKTINGTAPAGAANRASAAAATCDILHLNLAPLDLDLLGLQVHLDRVVLNIVAVSGAGNLLGNLLCAVTGLLDGTGVLGQLTGLLNQILSLLRLG